MKNNLLSDKNSGLKKNDGTINQLINLTNQIYQGFDDEMVAMIFLDLSKPVRHMIEFVKNIYCINSAKLGLEVLLIKYLQPHGLNHIYPEDLKGLFMEGNHLIFWTSGVPYLKVQYFHHFYF